MAPIITVFYLDYVHIDFKTFAFYQSFVMIAAACLEVPTGAFADVYGRKKTFIVAQVIYFLALTVLVVFPGILSLVAASVLLPVAISLGSGNFEAIIYESFAKNDSLPDYKALMERSYAISLVIGILAALCGGYLAKKSIIFPVLLDCMSIFVVTLCCLFFLHDTHVNRDGSVGSHFKESHQRIIQTILLVAKSPSMLSLIISMGSIFAVVRGIFVSYQPLLLAVGLSYESLGTIFAAFGVISAIFAYGAPKFSAKSGNVSPKKMTVGLALLLVASAVLFQVSDFFAVFAAIGLHQVVRGIFLPYFRFHINTNVGTDFTSRATLLSVVSLASSGICALAVFLVGMIESQRSLASAVSIVTVLFAVIAALPWLFAEFLVSKNAPLKA